jgi:hypothetical protein
VLIRNIIFRQFRAIPFSAHGSPEKDGIIGYPSGFRNKYGIPDEFRFKIIQVFSPPVKILDTYFPQMVQPGLQLYGQVFPEIIPGQPDCPWLIADMADNQL